MLVDDIPDFANAMSTLKAIGSETTSYALNSHGAPGVFSIGTDVVKSNTDVSELKPGLSGKTVFIGACETGAADKGSVLVENFSKSTESSVIGADHKLNAGYTYNGKSEGLTGNPKSATLLQQFGLNIGNSFKLSINGSKATTIYNISIDKKSGVSIGNKNNLPFPPVPPDPLKNQKK